MDVDGSGRGLIWGTITAFFYRNREKPRKPQSGLPITGPRFEHETSRIRSWIFNRTDCVFLWSYWTDLCKVCILHIFERL